MNSSTFRRLGLPLLVAAAWSCKLGDAMVRPPENRCQVW